MTLQCLHQTTCAEWAKRNSGLSTCQHSNPITLVSTVIFNISLSLKYSRGEPKCLFSSDGPYASEQRRDLAIEYFRKWGSVANYSGFVHSCVNLFFLWKQVHIWAIFPRAQIPETVTFHSSLAAWNQAAPKFAERQWNEFGNERILFNFCLLNQTFRCNKVRLTT